MSRASLLQDDNVIDVSPFIVNDDEVSAKQAQVDEGKRRNRMLILSFAAMVLFGLGNKIFQIIQMTAIYNYPLFLSNFTTFVYVPLSFFYIWPMQKWGTAITPEMEALPKSAFFYIGALDSLAGVMQVLSINYIQNGTLVVLIMQMAIPISMIISKYSLGAKYRMSQYVGCLIVAAGLATVLIPTFLEKKDIDECSTDADPLTMGISMLVLVLSNLPMCYSTVVKEKVLGDAAIDAVYLNGWVALFQALIGIPLIFPAAPTVNVAFKDIPQNLIDGAKCYMGTNSIIKPETVQSAITALGTAAGAVATSAAPKFLSNFYSSGRTSDLLAQVSGDDKCDKTHYDDCAMAPIYVNIYMFFNILYNILIILIIKYGSANILWIAMTVMVPFSSLAFSLDFMPNSKALKPTDILGLVVIMCGLVTYRFYPQVRQAMCGKSIQDLAEEHLLETEVSRPVVNAINSSSADDEHYDDAYQTPAVRPGSFSNRSDSYMPAVVDEYDEASLAPGVEENATAGKKKKKGSKRK